MMAKNRIYKLKFAAEMLGWSRWTLSRAMRNKLVPFHTMPSGRRYLTSEDLRQIEEQSFMGGPEDETTPGVVAVEGHA
jgi:hypothetical protein